MKRTAGTWRCVSRTLLLLTAFVFSGCSGRDGGPERVVVCGAVTYNGQPVAEGKIRFLPTAASPVPMSGAFIIDGKYRADSNGGVPVGTHKIQIEAYRKTASPVNPGERLPPGHSSKDGRQQYLPKKYNAHSELEITLPAGQKLMIKDFSLTH